MIVVPYKAEHLLRMDIQPGQGYSLPFITPEYARMLEDQFSFTAVEGDEIVAIGGVAKIWDHRGLAWAFLDKHAGRHIVGLHKAVKAMLDLVPYQRVEAETAIEFKEGHRWLKMLGFELEAPRLRANRPDGGDSSLYARVR